MKARIHLFEHEQTDSLFVMNKAQEGQPLYIRFDGCESIEDLIPCDLMVVSKYVDIEVGDICLVHDKSDDSYTFDEAKEIVVMSDLGSELKDVFIGRSGLVISLDNVEKVMATSSDSGDDSLVPYMESNLIATCIFAHNTGEQLDEVFINSDGLITIGNEDDVNIITYINQNEAKVGEITIRVDERGVGMTLSSQELEDNYSINIEQLSNIVGYILSSIRDLKLQILN